MILPILRVITNSYNEINYQYLISPTLKGWRNASESVRFEIPSSLKPYLFFVLCMCLHVIICGVFCQVTRDLDEGPHDLPTNLRDAGSLPRASHGGCRRSVAPSCAPWLPDTQRLAIEGAMPKAQRGTRRRRGSDRQDSWLRTNGVNTNGAAAKQIN